MGMEMLYSAFVIWMMTAVALGVGGSSLAIMSFLVALDDKKIDASERRMLNVIYWLLRTAMVLIPFTLVVLWLLKPGFLEGIYYVAIIMGVIYLNAAQMTWHLIPGLFGPALQAASWYTLGFLLSIELFDLLKLDWTLFFSLYIFDIIFFYAILWGIRYWQTHR